MKKENQKKSEKATLNVATLLQSETFTNCKKAISEKATNEKAKIYKSEIFATLTKKSEKSKLRNMLRKQLQDFVKNLFKSETENEITKVLDNFLKHYAENYVTNDFSVSSVSTSDETKKDNNLIAFLDIAKQYANK